MPVTKERPRVSIVTPSYNQAEYLRETLESVRSQTYEPLEHVVVDGASADETQSILTKYESTYPLRWISEPDEGQAAAINKGFEMASGDIVGWLNADDFYPNPETIERVVNAFRRDEVDIVHGDLLLISPDGRIFRRFKRRRWSYARLLRAWTLGQPAVFFTSEVTDRHRLDESLEYVMDFEYWLRIFDDFEWTHLDEILAADRLYAESKRFQDPDQARTEAESVLETHRDGEMRAEWLKYQFDRLVFGSDRVYGGVQALRVEPDEYSITLRRDLRATLLSVLGTEYVI